METRISEELLKRIRWKVDAGIYESVDEVLERALDLLDQRDVAVELVRDLVQESISDFEAGRYKTYSKENRDELLEDIKQRELELESERRRKRSNRWTGTIYQTPPLLISRAFAAIFEEGAANRWLVE